MSMGGSLAEESINVIQQAYGSLQKPSAVSEEMIDDILFND